MDNIKQAQIELDIKNIQIRQRETKLMILEAREKNLLNYIEALEHKLALIEKGKHFLDGLNVLITPLDFEDIKEPAGAASH